MQRAADIFLTVALAPIWLPVAALVALAVRISLGAPVLFVDERAGKGGKAFRLFKFRTMLPGDAPDAERITGLGRVLRATSLDELPEMWNVLRGDMSLVGPRPLPVRYLPRYAPWQRRRHDVMPGVTGWAQVNGRNAISWDEKFRLDVEYVERRSAALYAKILFMTVARVLTLRDTRHPGSATMPEFAAPETTAARGT